MTIIVDDIATIFLRYLQTVQANPSLAYATALIRLQGGYETAVFRFQLKGAQGVWAAPLILRLYPPRFGTRNALWESTVQNTLAAAGYPVPRAHLVCSDMTVLGGAFFIMDFLSGAPLITAPKATVPTLLGQSHARLHGIDPQPLIEALTTQKITGRTYHLDSRYDELTRKAEQYPHLSQTIAWLMANRPTEPASLSICHGDFHPLNILIDNGKVSGVIDWPGFVITDPALDVATTLILGTIPIKHLAPQLGLDFTAADVEPLVEGYLAAYESIRPLDRTNLPYYQVFRAVKALIEGADGQEVWRHPAIVADLVALIQSVTGNQTAVLCSGD